MVSRKYISAWADEKKIIDVIDFEGSRGYSISYERATRVNYAYEANLLEQTDLEGEFSRIESDAIPAFVKLRNDELIDRDEQHSVIAFLDMHLERGLYADQTKIPTQAVAVMIDGTSKPITLGLADRLIFSRYMEGASRLADHGLEEWPWTVYEGGGLVTGDGAVLRWAESKENSALRTVTFPLSPTRLLVIGHPIDESIPVNEVLARNCRRWLVGRKDTLTKDSAVLAAIPRPERYPDISGTTS